VIDNRRVGHFPPTRRSGHLTDLERIQEEHENGTRGVFLPNTGAEV